MQEFWQAFFIFLGVAAICLTVFFITLAVLLSLPQSRFRSFVKEILGWTAAATAVAGVLSPLDFIPDVIPVAGQADDLLYIIGGIMSAYFAYTQRRWRGQHPPADLVHIDMTKNPEKLPTGAKT